MDWEWIAAVSGFALAMAGTPGPNNTMVAASGANHGLRRTLPFMSGITIGVTTIILAAGILGSSILAHPPVGAALKWLGAAYLLWLAWRIGTTRPAMESPEESTSFEGRPPSAVQGALLQLINPKLWAMVAGAVVTYGGAARNESSATIAVAFGIIFGTATLASTAAWTLIGVATGRFIKAERTMRLFNRAMAALLALSLIPALID